MIKCLICECEFKKDNVLARHIKKEHNLNYNEYMNMFFFPKQYCPIPNCGKESSWKNYKHGYNIFCKEHGKKYSSILTKEYWIYCKGLSEEEAVLLISKKQSKGKTFFKEKYGNEEGEKKFKEKNDNSTFKKTKEGLIEKYGIEEGTKIFNQRKEHHKKTCSTQYLLDKYGQEKFDSIKKARALNQNSYEWWVRQGFTDDEIKILKPKKLKESNNRCKEHWIKKGFSEEEAIKIISENQRTFSKEICIEKYGEEEGLKVWQERQDKWQNTLKSKSDYEDIVIKRTISFGYSKSSQKFFNELMQMIENNDKIYFYSLNKEFLKYDKERKCCYLYDFVDSKNKKCIEYNGDIWHANPQIYNENDCPNPMNKDITAREIWEQDKIKLNLLKKDGYQVLVVWENDIKNNKNLILKECLDFLNERKMNEITSSEN